MLKGGVNVIIGNIENNPCCPHGPTILFSKSVKNVIKQYYACSSCRDKKDCNFFLWEDQINKYNTKVWNKEILKFKKGIKHDKKFKTLTRLIAKNASGWFCNTCNKLSTDFKKHETHRTIKWSKIKELDHPSKILPPLNDSKKEAQYHFTDSAVEEIVNILKSLNYKAVICLGTPRIHEYIRLECSDMNSLLLDIDKRFHSFFSPLEFCWYNMFNNHFFFDEAHDVFKTFIKVNSNNGMALITDPPFGGRTEILSETFKRINEEYKSLNTTENDLDMFWIYPYFMEPQIKNYMNNLVMLDYKVEYENHRTFQNGPGGRKHGSPIRIFTNVNPGLIKLPNNDYTYCKICNRWVSKENRHCNICNACTSKNGESYVHCIKCKRCVKPSWKHCEKCNRCAQIDHTCKILNFTKECFKCSQPGHKQVDCPSNQTNVIGKGNNFNRKRKKGCSKLGQNKKNKSVG